MLKKTIGLLAVLVLVLGHPTLAAVGKTWKTSGSQQFAAGKLEGVAVFSTGEVELAPDTEEIEGLEAEIVWDMEAAADGTVYVATGSPAAVYTIKGDKVELLHKSEDKHVLSVLPLPDGSVLAGTAPKGIVYRIDRRGDVSVLADLEGSYVWDMALSPFNEIYCATGPEGKLIQLNRAGKATERLKAKQKNLMCVAVDKEGTAYVGTDGDGYIYRLERGDQATVLYDANESEIHDLVVDAQGVVYACTAQSERSRQAPSRPSGSPGGTSTPPPALPLPTLVQGAPAAHNSIYRVVPGEGGTLLARFDKMFVLSLALVEDKLFVGTGTSGRLMTVRPDTVFTILAEFDAAHITAMAVDSEGDIVIGTSNPGSLRRLKKGYRSEGAFISEPFDGGYLSRWGRVWWREQVETGQRTRIKLRTGNSGEPDEHWSPWSRWATDSAGETLGVPMGRFAQFSAELSTRPKTGSPLLREVMVSYRQVNRRPRIDELKVDGESLLNKPERRGSSGSARSQASGSAGAGRARGEPAQRTLTWKATDPNGDELFFELFYRGVEESEWKQVNKDLRGETSHKWDTSRVADGYYVLKLVASDSAVRPKAEALADERVSGSLLIDNRRPAVEKLTARLEADDAYRISGVARDQHGAITRIEVSHDSGDWMPVFPSDGILDSGEEEFSYTTESLEPGEHVFVFAATDSNENTGSGKVVLRVRAARE